MHHHLRLSFALALALPAAACGGDDGGAAVDAPGPDAMLGDPAVLVGSFVVSLVDAEPPYTSVVGVVNDKVPPEAVAWDVATTAGDCRLLKPRVPFCTPACGGTAVCVADNTCEPYAVKQDVGTVTLSGRPHLDRRDPASTLVFPSSTIRTYQVPGTISLAYPGFAAGDTIAITATGSSFTPAFSISATAIAPLVVTNPDRDLARDAPLDLTWTPPTGGGATEIFLKLDISHHGGSKGKIECTTADDGALTLSAAMVTELLDLGAAGFPTVILERRAVGSALTTAGRVDLMIGSEIERPVTVPGVISCDGDEDCTPPATCQSDLTCG
jgi:hypothetical protein